MEILKKVLNKLKGDFMNSPKSMKISVCIGLVAVITVVALLGSGCSYVDKRFLDNNHKAATMFGNDLKEYVEKDDSLPDNSKQRRIKSIESWQKSTKTALDSHQ